MTYIIAEPCIDIKDLSCVDVCPVDCIHVFERILIIDPEECIDCGACEPECPVEAIFPEDALPEKWEPFVKINYAYGEGPEVVNKLVDERSLHRPLEALAEAEEDDGEREDRHRRGGLERGAPEQHEDPRGRPEHAHEGEGAHPAPALEELGHGQLRDGHDERVQEEDHSDPTLAHARLVLREDGQQLDLGVPGRDENDVETD